MGEDVNALVWVGTVARIPIKESRQYTFPGCAEAKKLTWLFH